MLVIAALALLIVSGCGSKDSSSGTSNSGNSTSVDQASAPTGDPATAGNMTEAQAKAEEKKHFSSEPPPIQTLVGNTTGYWVNKPTVVVSKSASELKVVKAKHFSHGVKREELAPIDFKTRQIVSLFMPKDKKGTEVTITDVHQEGDTIVVTAVKLPPGKGCSVSGPAPRPFHWVETRKMTPTNVKLKLTVQRASPCLKQ